MTLSASHKASTERTQITLGPSSIALLDAGASSVAENLGDGPMKITRMEMENAAREEDWNYVDSNISTYVKNPDAVGFAYREEIDDPDENIRDLGLTVIGAADIPPEEFDIMRNKIATKLEDPGAYVPLRAADVLVVHGPGRYIEKTRKTLERYREDPDEDARKVALEDLDKLD